MKRQFATFHLEDTLFGIDVLLVDEVNRQLDIVPVAGAPEVVRGFLNLRGQIVTVVDLGVRIGSGSSTITPRSRCIVLKTSRDISHLREKNLLDDDTCPDMVGLLVSDVDDMVTIDESEIDPVPANVGESANRFIAGVVQLDDVLLNVLRVKEVVDQDDAEIA